MKCLPRVMLSYLSYKLHRYRPIMMTLRVTYACNLKCSFCTVPQTGVYSLETEEALDAISQFRELGGVYLNITGGEPLLVRDIERIGQRARELGIVTMLNTNGTLITDSNAARISQSFDMINVSLDGLPATHDRIRGAKGSFERALHGLQRIRKVPTRRAKAYIHFVATKENQGEMRAFFNRYGGHADAFSVMPAFDVGKNRVFDDAAFVQSWNELGDAYPLQMPSTMIRKPMMNLGKHYCDAGRLYFSIIPNGDVVACSNNLGITLGNLHHSSLRECLDRRESDHVDSQILGCKGCFCRSTTELSMQFRKSPFTLAKEAPDLLRKYAFL